MTGTRAGSCRACVVSCDVRVLCCVWGLGDQTVMVRGALEPPDADERADHFPDSP